MNLKTLSGVLIALLLSGSSVFAQQGDAGGQAAGDPSQREVAPETARTPAKPEAGEEETPPADDVFIPSEEVQAAEELAFPVDI